MSSEEWNMLAYAAVAAGALGIGMHYAGMERFHRMFLCAIFPVAIQLILFWFACVLSEDKGWLGLGVVLLALFVVPITAVLTTISVFKAEQQATLSLAISNMLRSANVPFAMAFVAMLA